MILTNQTKKTTLSTNLKEAKSTRDKFLGLLIKNNSRSLLFYTRFGIHTFFLKEPIDVLVLNSKNIVVRTRSLSPNRIFIYNPVYITIIELPQKTILKSKTKIGDKLKIK